MRLCVCLQSFYIEVCRIESCWLYTYIMYGTLRSRYVVYIKKSVLMGNWKIIAHDLNMFILPAIKSEMRFCIVFVIYSLFVVIILINFYGRACASVIISLLRITSTIGTQLTITQLSSIAFFFVFFFLWIPYNNICLNILIFLFVLFVLILILRAATIYIATTAKDSMNK